jgi:LacI family transcriptional regulator
MSVTISDVARLANVSKATVSAVINDRPGISQKTRERVLEIASRLNFRPNQVARSLSIRKTYSIGLVIKEIDNPFFAQIMKGVYDTCVNHAYTVLLGSSELSPQRELQSIETLVNQRVEGLILSPLHGEDMDFYYLADLIHDRYPLVTLGEISNYGTSVVEAKNEDGAFEAVRHLIHLGHKRIAYFSGPAHSSHAIDRAEGYRRAFLESHLPYRSDDVVQVGSYIENGYEAGKRFFTNRKDRPTAVLCYNDLVAMGLINALFDVGFSVPDDISVIGFDDIQYGAHFRVPLTTVHVPTYEIGKTAAEMVIGQIDDPEKSRQEKKRFDVQLVHRKSTSSLN